MKKQQPRKNSAPAHAPQAHIPVRLGLEHGYQVTGETVRLNAELQLPAYLSSGDYALELWACAAPCEPIANDQEVESTRFLDPAEQVGALLVATLATQLPTPLSSLAHRVEGEVQATFPASGTSFAMVLVLVHAHAGGKRSVVDVANYCRRESFPSPQLQGEVGYEIDGNEVILRVECIANERASGNASGTLALELWTVSAADPSAAPVTQLASFELLPISGGYYLSPVVCRASFKRPAVGHWRTAILLREWTESGGYVTRDQRQTAELEIGAAVASESVVGAAERSVPAKALVCLQTASVEELAKLEGLNARIAKEIVKARPLASWGDVLKVRGIGQATMQKLKSSVSL